MCVIVATSAAATAYGDFFFFVVVLRSCLFVLGYRNCNWNSATTSWFELAKRRLPGEWSYKKEVVPEWRGIISFVNNGKD